MNAPSPSTNPDTALTGLLGADAVRPWWRRPTLWIAIGTLALAAGGWFWWQGRQARNEAPQYSTVAVTRGNLTLSVSANGTLQPTRSVSIGSELSGTVSKVHVDINDVVRRGQVLVELDTAKLRDQIARSRAGVASAQARLAATAATVKEAQGNLARLEEVARLSGGKVPSQAELASGRAAVERAQAEQAAAQAALADARAANSTDETNLSKASIRSPIDGIVLSRTVDPGNAVAASLQAVTLFTIANDLKRMEARVNVDEADVGAVAIGQKATFTVAAHPGRQFPATVRRVAFGSTTSDNVITYVTTLDVTNDDLSLRPGMTASATIVANERRDVLLVPNTALRFKPGTGAAAPASAAADSGIVGKLMPRMPRAGGNRRSGTDSAAANGSERSVWILKDGQPQAVRVTTGIADGRFTEVTGGDLQAGMQVITDQRSGPAP